MPSVPPLSGQKIQAGGVCVVFASGTRELNRAIVEDFASHANAHPLCVVAEFEPERGEWIPWHVRRSAEQNLAFVKAALGDRRIEAAAVAYDRRSGLGDLRNAAFQLAPGVVTAYDEEMRVAGPGGLRAFLFRRGIRAMLSQLRSGGRTRAWLRRLAHPSDAEIPLRARAAQAMGLAAGRLRAQSTEKPLVLRHDADGRHARRGGDPRFQIRGGRDGSGRHGRSGR